MGVLPFVEQTHRFDSLWEDDHGLILHALAPLGYGDFICIARGAAGLRRDELTHERDINWDTTDSTICAIIRRVWIVWMIWIYIYNYIYLYTYHVFIYI